MMKSKLAAIGLMAGVLMTPVLSQAADSDSAMDQPGVFVKDSVITTKVKTKLASEHLTSATRIKVDTDKDGVVWLSGFANSRAEADRAVALASATDGVRSVKDHLVVKN